MRRYITIIFVCVFFALSTNARGQSPYSIKLKKEAIHIGVGSLSLGIGFRLQDETTLFTPNELATFSSADVNPFDRLATDFSSENAHRLSNYFFYGSAAFPAMLMLGDASRKDAGTIGLMWFETMLVNGGATHLCKHTFRRPRPYVFDKNIDPAQKMTTNAQASFVSGHTSLVAANSFFAASVFSEYYPDSPWKKVAWSVAVTVPAITGYLRVRAGRHYPTDVIGGYALGTIIGWGVPALHRTKILEEKNVKVAGGLTGVRVRWDF